MTTHRSTTRLEHALRSRGATPSDDLAGALRLTRDARALRPEILDGIERRLQDLELAYEVEAANGAVDPVEMLDDLLLPFVRARVPLRPRARATAWAHDTVLGLLERFVVEGRTGRQVPHDPDGPGEQDDPAALVVRLALAAAWLAWSDRLVDPGATRTHRAVLRRALDTIDTGLHREGWAPRPVELDMALAALVMEQRLARHDPRAHAAVQ